MKKNYPTLKNIAPIIFLLFSVAVFSQTSIKSQSFDSGASGYSDDLGYTVSNLDYVTVTGTTSESSSNSLRFSNNNDDVSRDSDVVFDNLDISAFLNTSVTVSFKAVGVDRSEDLYLDISYDDGVSYSDRIQLVDGDRNNPDIDWGSTDGDSDSVSSNPYTFFVPAGNNQIRIRIRATNLDNNEFFYVDNIIIKSEKYCRSSGSLTNSYTDVIRRVQFNTINNSSPSNDNGYSDFTGISTIVTQGTSYNLNVNVETDGDETYNTIAWIDWNQDGDFSDAGNPYNLGSARRVTNSPTSNSPLAIIIPTTSIVGPTRMRVSTRWNRNPTSCDTGFDGEVEDYTINIIASRTITTGTISPTSYCAGASVSIPYTKTGTFNTDNIFTAQLSDATGNFGSSVTIGTLSSTAAGTISGTIPVATISETGYRIRVVSSTLAVTGSTNVSNLTVYSTSAVGAVSTNQTICSGNSPSSNITISSATGTIQWQRADNAGFTTNLTDIGTNSTTLTSAQIGALTATRYFRAVVTSGSCAFATSGTVTVTVSPLLTASVSIAANPSLIVCNGTSVTYTATPTNGGSAPAYQWKVNGTNVGTNSPTYTYVPVDEDEVSVVLTSNDACASGLLTQPILNFSWNDDTKAIKDSDFGIDARSGSGQYYSGGVGGTLGLGPIITGSTRININFIFDGGAPEFNSEGIDYSLSYLRNESSSELFTRGSSLIITGGANFSVSYRVSDGAGSFTTVTSGNFPIPSDNAFRNYRFRYDPSDGFGRLYVDGAQVWISPASTLGKPMYWTSAGDVIVGRETDGSGMLSPTFDDLLLSAVYVKSAALQVTMTVNTIAEPPIIESTTQPTCTVSTGSITLVGLPEEAWTLNQSGQAVNTISGTGSTKIISGLAVGNYTFTVGNLSCTSSSSDIATISNANVPINTWSGNAWSLGPPTLDQKIVFDDSYEEFVDVVNGCSCIVSAGKTVTIKSGKTLRIVNQIEVIGDGTLTFEDKSSLVQIKDVPAKPNSGKITYIRSTPLILKTDYVYWSTPVATAPLWNIQSGTLYYSFNASGNKWVKASAGTAMDTGKGYIVRGAGTWFDKGDITLTANFEEAPNNGIIPASLTPGKNNLIGNPYPSAIDGDAFISANTSATALSNSLTGTLYFWTHGSEIKLATAITVGTPGEGKYAYTSDDYDTYTLTGGTGGLTGTIAAGQGFFAPASSTGGNAIFNNSMRLSTSSEVLDNTQFLKQVVGSKAIKIASSNKLDKNRVWLNLTNAGGAFKQVLIGYITGATNGYESTYDGNNFNANSFVNFYSINQNRNLTIQGRALPFDENDVVPLGYKSTIVGEFKIAIDKTDGFLSKKKINLEDKLLGKIQDLSEAPYIYTTEIGTFNDRFVLTYATKTVQSTITLGTGDYKEASGAVLISNKNKEIKISTPSNEIDKVFVYDVTGRQLYMKLKVDKSELIINTIMSSNQVLIVKVILQNGETVTQKILY